MSQTSTDFNSMIPQQQQPSAPGGLDTRCCPPPAPVQPGILPVSVSPRYAPLAPLAPPQPPLPPTPEQRANTGVEVNSTSSTNSTPPLTATGETSTSSTNSTGPLTTTAGENSTTSTNSRGPRIHEAIFPDDTILTDYLEYARRLEESADCYLLGSILPAVAAALGRKVWFQLGAKKIYPNLFSMLVGKPGDRKSSAINLAYQVARPLLPSNTFLSPTGSAEAYFDEYDPRTGGCPDKFLVCDDANPLLSTWKNTSYGENVATRFLNLYDCSGLSETFKRNLKLEPQPGADPSPLRRIEETSTSVLLGATFVNARFQGHQVRTGLERRFLHYVAERPSRMLVLPPCPPSEEVLRIENLFKKLLDQKSVICQLTPAAFNQWISIQCGVRVHGEDVDGTSPDGEAALSRLNSQPTQILKVAMCFQACRAAKSGASWNGHIEEDILLAAKRHVELCHESAGYIDDIGSRAETCEQAAVIFGRIQHDYRQQAQNGWITFSRSDLTAKFCHHDRRGAMRPHDLYHRIIPELVRQGLVIEEPKEGKLQRYRFLVGEV